MKLYGGKKKTTKTKATHDFVTVLLRGFITTDNIPYFFISFESSKFP